MKRLVLLVAFLPSLVLAAKDDMSSPPKTAPAAAKGESKSSPPTDKRVLHLDLKK